MENWLKSWALLGMLGFAIPLSAADENCRRELAEEAVTQFETLYGQADETLANEPMGLRSKSHWVHKTGAIPRPTDPVIVLIPGGPGLSSNTVRPLQGLRRSFDLVFVDPPGTGGLPQVDFTRFPTKKIFWEVVASIERELEAIRRPIVLVGHSFGGYYAGAIALRDKRNHLNIEGITFISTAIRKDTFNEIMRGRIRQWERSQSKADENNRSALAEARQAYMNNPSPEKYREWVAAYGLLIFSEKSLSQGRKLLLGDPSFNKPPDAVCPSSAAFIQMDWRDHESYHPISMLDSDYLNILSQESITMGQFAVALRQSPHRKVAIIGAADILLSAEELKDDAVAAGVREEDLIFIPEGSHFPFLEDTEAVISGIESRFLPFRASRLPR